MDLVQLSYPHLIGYPVGDMVLYINQNITIVAPGKDMEVVIWHVVEANAALGNLNVVGSAIKSTECFYRLEGINHRHASLLA